MMNVATVKTAYNEAYDALSGQTSRLGSIRRAALTVIAPDCCEAKLVLRLWTDYERACEGSSDSVRRSAENRLRKAEAKLMESYGI